jgi:hypothetical protein
MGDVTFHVDATGTMTWDCFFLAAFVCEQLGVQPGQGQCEMLLTVPYGR